MTFLVGLDDDQKSELIFTPDGRIQNVYWAERLANSSPRIPNWKFKALKPAANNANFAIKVHDLYFDRKNIKFFPVTHDAYPDKIDLTFVYDHYHQEAHQVILNGIYIFLDNFLGEETMIEYIDKIDITGPQKIHKELIPLDKLKEFVIWREKEFVEKYHDVRHDPSQDEFSALIKPFCRLLIHQFWVGNLRRHILGY